MGGPLASFPLRPAGVHLIFSYFSSSSELMLLVYMCYPAHTKHQDHGKQDQGYPTQPVPIKMVQLVRQSKHSHKPALRSIHEDKELPWSPLPAQGLCLPWHWCWLFYLAQIFLKLSREFSHQFLHWQCSGEKKKSLCRSERDWKIATGQRPFILVQPDLGAESILFKSTEQYGTVREEGLLPHLFFLSP